MTMNLALDALFLMTLGCIMLTGLLVSAIGRHTFLPRVTLLLILGALLGEQGFGIIPTLFTENFDLIAEIALLMVGFLLGGKLTKSTFSGSIKVILWLSLCNAVVTAIAVSTGLFIFKLNLELAILLGCIAAATAPAAILDVVMESEAKGQFTEQLLSIVAIDDVWALILFAFGVSLVMSFQGDTTNNSAFLFAIHDLGGALLLGIIIGIPATYLTGRLKAGQPIVSEALGIVFLCGGLAIWLEVSFLIAAMVMGIVITNFAKHHEYPFHAIEGIESQVMVVFFLLAGAMLDLAALKDLGVIGVVYIGCRVFGKVVGTAIGGQISQAQANVKKWMGVALLPQAGVAIGMALVASSYFPEYRQTLLTVVISSTIFFELVGPVFTRIAIQKAGEANQ